VDGSRIRIKLNFREYWYDSRLFTENLQWGFQGERTDFQRYRSEVTYHTSIHATQTPHVQAVIVLLEIDQQLGTLEVS
jgi:hypothetical protein